MRSNEIFEEIKKTVEAVSPPLTLWCVVECGCVLQGGEDLVKKVKGIFLFKITDSGGKETQWIVDLKNGKGSVKNTPGMITPTNLSARRHFYQCSLCT